MRNVEMTEPIGALPTLRKEWFPWVPPKECDGQRRHQEGHDLPPRGMTSPPAVFLNEQVSGELLISFYNLHKQIVLKLSKFLKSFASYNVSKLFSLSERFSSLTSLLYSL